MRGKDSGRSGATAAAVAAAVCAVGVAVFATLGGGGGGGGSCVFENVAPFRAELVQLANPRRSRGTLAPGARVAFDCDPTDTFGAFRKDGGDGDGEKPPPPTTPTTPLPLPLPLVSSLGPYHAPRPGKVLRLGREYRKKKNIIEKIENVCLTVQIVNNTYSWRS